MIKKTEANMCWEYSIKIKNTIEIFINQHHIDIPSKHTREVILKKVKDITLNFLNAKVAHFTESDDFIIKAFSDLDDLEAILIPFFQKSFHETDLLYLIKQQIDEINTFKNKYFPSL